MERDDRESQIFFFAPLTCFLPTAYPSEEDYRRDLEALKDKVAVVRQRQEAVDDRGDIKEDAQDVLQAVDDFKLCIPDGDGKSEMLAEAEVLTRELENIIDDLGQASSRGPLLSLPDQDVVVEVPLTPKVDAAGSDKSRLVDPRADQIVEVLSDLSLNLSDAGSDVEKQYSISVPETPLSMMPQQGDDAEGGGILILVSPDESSPQKPVEQQESEDVKSDRSSAEKKPPSRESSKEREGAGDTVPESAKNTSKDSSPGKSQAGDESSPRKSETPGSEKEREHSPKPPSPEERERISPEKSKSKEATPPQDISRDELPVFRATFEEGDVEFNVTQEAVWKEPEEDLGIVEGDGEAPGLLLVRDTSLDEAFQRLSPALSEDDLVDFEGRRPPLKSVSEEGEEVHFGEPFEEVLAAKLEEGRRAEGSPESVALPESKGSTSMVTFFFQCKRTEF